MLKSFICGAGDFHQQLDDPSTTHSTPSPKKPSRTTTSKTKKKNKNPYSTSGLDKFALVLADLNERRQKVYKQIGSPKNDPLVRFDWVPIAAIKVNEQKQDKKNKTNVGDNTKVISHTNQSFANDVETPPTKTNVETKKRRYDYYLPILMILILVCLVLYGRSFAILCTSVWVYIMPATKRTGSNSKLKMRDYKRIISAINIRINGFTQR